MSYDRTNDEKMCVVSKVADTQNRDPSALRLLRLDETNKLQKPFGGCIKSKNKLDRNFNKAKLDKKDYGFNYASFNDKNKKLSGLKSILSVLPEVNKKTRIRWSKELVCKLRLAQEIFTESDYDITLNCLKVDSNNNLVVDLINLKSAHENSIYYKSPEEFFGEHNQSNEKKLWAAGICIYYINTMNFPWKRASLNDKSFRRWVKEKRFNHKLDERIFDVISLLLTVDSNKRPKIRKVIEKAYEEKPRLKVISKFFKNIKLYSKSF